MAMHGVPHKICLHYREETVPKAVRRAVAAECAGGKEALKALHDWADVVGRSEGEEKREAKNVARVCYEHIRDIVEAMEADVRKRWGLRPKVEPE